MYVSAEGGGAESSFPPLEGEGKSRMGDSPAPPTLTWSSLGQSSKRKVFGGKVGVGVGGIKTTGAGADFAAFPCSAPREYISIPYPTFYPSLDPKLSPLS